MSITKFVTRSYGNEIRPVDVLRETESSVFVRGHKNMERRRAKASSYENYHDSWDAAKQHLVDRAETELAAARRRLEVAQGSLGNVKGLKKPEGL